jgi:hypothetical protein
MAPDPGNIDRQPERLRSLAAGRLRAGQCFATLTPLD